MTFLPNSQESPAQTATKLCTCMNGGFYTDDDSSGIIGSIDGSGTVCRCPSGFTGALCETNITNSGEIYIPNSCLVFR